MMASPLPFLGEKYTELYEYLMVDHGLTEVHVMALLPYVAFQVVSLFCLAFYTACDRFGWFSKYKIYRSKAVPKPTFGMMLEAHISFFVGYTIGMIPLLYYSGIALLEYAGYSARPEDLPSVWHTIAYLVGCIFVSETVFYWCHRILHHPRLYKHYHRKHHEFKGTTAIAFQYSSLTESLSNLANVLGPAFLFRGHAIEFSLWLCIRVWESMDAHSGYQFPFPYPNWWFATFPHLTGGADRHDYHHAHNIGMYGSFSGFWDWIMGTDYNFMEYQKRQENLRIKSQ